jgi:Mce-associated membrane protein
VKPARGPLTVILVATLAVFATLTAALSAFAAQRDSHQHVLDQARRDAVAAATGGAAVVLSYDYRHLQRDFARAEAVITPRFRTKYDATTAKAVEPLAVKYKVVTTAQVAAAGSVTNSADRATVLVFVDQTSTNSQLSAPRLDRSRITVVLLRTGGRWLIDDLKPI